MSCTFWGEIHYINVERSETCSRSRGLSVADMLGLHPGGGVSSVIHGCFNHCGNSDEKSISEK